MGWGWTKGLVAWVGLTACETGTLYFHPPGSLAQGERPAATQPGGWAQPEPQGSTTEVPPPQPGGDSETPAPIEAPPAAEPPSYVSILNSFFVVRCLNCHGILPDGQGPLKFPDLSDLQRIRHKAAKIDETVFEKRSMPPRRDVARHGPLTPEQLGLLRAWLDAGLPE